MSALNKNKRIRIGQLAILLAGIGLVEWTARSGVVGEITLVSLVDISETIFWLITTGEILADLWQTISTTFLSFGLAAVFGIMAGWLLWQKNQLQTILDPYLIVLYSMPLFVFYPVLIAIFGLNRTPIIIIAFLMSVSIIIINTANGFNHVDDIYGKVGQSLQLSRSQTFRHIYFPAATPYIFTGLKLGFIYSLIGVIASEFILASGGLGYQVSHSYTLFDTETMYATMFLVILFSVTINILLRKIENVLYKRVTN